MDGVYRKIKILDQDEYDMLSDEKNADGIYYFIMPTKKPFTRFSKINSERNYIRFEYLIFLIAIMVLIYLFIVACLMRKMDLPIFTELLYQFSLSYVSSYIFFALTIQLPILVKKKRFESYIAYKVIEIVDDVEAILLTMLKCSTDYKSLSQDTLCQMNKIDFNTDTEIRCIYNEQNIKLYVCFMEKKKTVLEKIDRILLHRGGELSPELLYTLEEINSSYLFSDLFELVVNNRECVDLSECTYIITDVYSLVEKIRLFLKEQSDNNLVNWMKSGIKLTNILGKDI